MDTQKLLNVPLYDGGGGRTRQASGGGTNRWKEAVHKTYHVAVLTLARNISDKLNQRYEIFHLRG